MIAVCTQDIEGGPAMLNMGSNVGFLTGRLNFKELIKLLVLNSFLANNFTL